MPVLRRLTGWHAIAMLSPAVEPKGAGWVLVRLTPSAEAVGMPCLLLSGRAAPVQATVLGAAKGASPSPPCATDPAFTPAAREGEVGLKTCTVTYTYTSNAHTHTDDDDSV